MDGNKRTITHHWSDDSLTHRLLYPNINKRSKCIDANKQKVIADEIAKYSKMYRDVDK